MTAVLLLLPACHDKCKTSDWFKAMLCSHVRVVITCSSTTLTKHRGLAVHAVLQFRLQSPFEHILMHAPVMTSTHTRPDSLLGQGSWNSWPDQVLEPPQILF